ncbi:MAG: penicillin-binding protein 2 [Rhodospirillales bacterium]
MNADRARIRTFTRRVLLLGTGKVLLLSALAGRMYQLQVLEADRYTLLAERNRINSYPLLPPRGVLFDRFGVPLARNRSSFAVVLRRDEATDPKASLRLLTQLTSLDVSDMNRVMADTDRRPSFVPVVVREDLSWRQVAMIEVNAPDLPGIDIVPSQRRFYPAGSITAHVVGYVGQPSDADVETATVPLVVGGLVGKTGLETAVDASLRGRSGVRHMEVDASGRPVRELSRKPAVPGQDIKTTLDLGLQETAMRRLSAERQGAAAVINVENGHILALASAPSFDPNNFVGGLSAQAWEALVADPDRPLLNKAIGGEYAPGSTFKMTVALAGLGDDVVGPDHKVYCPGYFRLGNSIFHCWKRQGHGRLDMVEAVAQSCDVYFYDLALRAGVERIANMARRLGFGETFDLGLPGERAGLVPTKAWKHVTFGRAWQKGETVITGIGQGYLTATPLQLAIMTARIVNRGLAVRPRLVLAEPPEGGWKSLQDPPSLGVAGRWLDLIREAMLRVVNSPRGTAYGAHIADPDRTMGGKTGTSQVRRITLAERRAGMRKAEEVPWVERDHALFVGWAPTHAPLYAAAVVVPHGGSGSRTAAPIARDILLEAQRRGSAGDKLSVI